MENNIIFARFCIIVKKQIQNVNNTTISSTKGDFVGLCNQKMSCLIGGGSCDFQPSFRGGSRSFVPRGGSCVF